MKKMTVLVILMAVLLAVTGCAPLSPGSIHMPTPTPVATPTPTPTPEPTPAPTPDARIVGVWTGRTDDGAKATWTFGEDGRYNEVYDNGAKVFTYHGIYTFTPTGYGGRLARRRAGGDWIVHGVYLDDDDPKTFTISFSYGLRDFKKKK